MSDNSDVEAYQPPNSIPIGRRRTRRSSFLDAGGDNSVNNFASSVGRSVGFLSGSFGNRAARGSRGSTSLSRQSSVARYESIGEFGAGPPDQDPNESSALIDESTLPPVIPEDSAKDSIQDETLPEVVISTKSTPLQTTFNSINVLIGLGVLSIPLAFHLAGWVPGLICLTLAAASTEYTAVLLGRIMARVPALQTYQDIAVYAFGDSVGYFIFATFTVDLFGAAISMVVLFSDSFNALFPTLPPALLKAGLCSVLLALNMLPLHILSFLSFTGIVCTSATCAIILLSGLLKATQPGSLLNYMPTNLFPHDWMSFCFALGLFLAPWGGHATFPEIYTDQKRPETYNRCMGASFSFSYFTYSSMGVIGYLMFGATIDDEVTRNVIRTPGFPGAVKTSIVCLMGLLPISKIPLCSRPLVTALDRASSHRVLNRVALSGVYFVSSLLFTSFGKIMSLLGSAICFTVCITLPVLFYLAIFRQELSTGHRTLLYIMLAVSLVCTVMGTLSAVYN